MSILQHLHHHLDPAHHLSPAFVSQRDARILDGKHLLDFVSRGVTRLILHLGTNDLATASVRTALSDYRGLLEHIREHRPDITSVYATLVLPRMPNRRHGSSNWMFIGGFNAKIRDFNGALRGVCHQERGTFFFDHCFGQFPARLVMVADGVPTSFVGVSYLAWNVHRLLTRCHRRSADIWRDHADSRKHVRDPGAITLLELQGRVSCLDDRETQTVHPHCPESTRLPHP